MYIFEKPKKEATISEPKKEAKKDSDDDFDLFASDEDTTKKSSQLANNGLYLRVENDQKTLVLLKPDAVHRNLMGDIICKFEERGFKMAAMKFVSPSEDLLKNHYADLSKKPFFPELVRYMRSGPIVAMVWTGLNIVPMVRAMVGATKPSDADPGSIRGDFCIDVGRNLIHASDSNESAAKEVEMWFPEQEIVQWRPCTLEWTYEDEVIEEAKCFVNDNYKLCPFLRKMFNVDQNILNKKGLYSHALDFDKKLICCFPIQGATIDLQPHHQKFSPSKMIQNDNSCHFESFLGVKIFDGGGGKSIVALCTYLYTNPMCEMDLD